MKQFLFSKIVSVSFIGTTYVKKVESIAIEFKLSKNLLPTIPPSVKVDEIDTGLGVGDVRKLIGLKFSGRAEVGGLNVDG